MKNFWKRSASPRSRKRQPSARRGKSALSRGFEDIQRFVEEHGHAPRHGEDRDIFERMYAVRLDRLRSLAECRNLIEPLDDQGLLEAGEAPAPPDAEDIDDEAILAELGVEAETVGITDLKHVRSTAEKRAAEEIANRTVCKDFDQFKPLFEQVSKELKSGIRQTRRFQTMAEIKKGEFFIVGGRSPMSRRWAMSS